MKSFVTLVLDTNVVLDWLVFKDQATNALRDGVHNNRIVVLTHLPAIDELRRVLTYPALRLDRATQQDILDKYRAQTAVATLPNGFSLQNLLLPPGFPSCRDRDDEHFLALGLHAKVGALVSRDKAILCLKKRAAKFALNILNMAEMNALLHMH